MSEPSVVLYRRVAIFCGLAAADFDGDHHPETRGQKLVDEYLGALGLPKGNGHRRGVAAARRRVIAGYLDHRYQGAMLLWSLRDRARGLPPPYGLGEMAL